ncbi:MAG: fructosamine kinase family protein [Balneolaceae bacterium]|nr:fructosamine kinase family protein [Balneolaceae bacterium]
MAIPNSIQDILHDLYDLDISGSRAVSGGSINQAYRLESEQGTFFLKFNASAPDDFFEKEAEGLNLLESAQSGLRIPEVIAAEKPLDGRPGFLLMEYIETGRSGNSFEFGAGLARLHQTHNDRFGLDTDNYIGSLPQSNQQHSDWPEFFSEDRIRPQLQMAIDSGKMDSKVLKQWDRIGSKLENLMPETEPSLIHGDLWGGNYLFDASGNAVLIDPAVYYGHPEMDLAFTHMFGGFSAEFYRGYQSVSTQTPDFDKRIPLYNLYPLLVHVNLFGGHYISQAEAVLRRFG